MKKSMMAAALVAALAAAAVAVPTQAEARRGYAAAGIIGGMSAGVIIASGAYPYYGYGYYPGYVVPVSDAGPAYYGPPPGCVLRRQRVYNGYSWQWQKIRVCH